MRNLVVIVLLLIANFTYAQTATYGLEVEISGFRSSEGQVLVQVFNDSKEVLKSLVVEIRDKKCTFTVGDLPKGQYAIRYFHDENSNRKLDTNFVGIPKEGYGFSNNASGYFGPPAFSKWLFDLDAEE